LKPPFPGVNHEVIVHQPTKFQQDRTIRGSVIAI